MPCKPVLSAAMKDNMPLHFKWEAEERSIKSENGQVQNRTRASDTHVLANKMLRGGWGLSFQRGLRMTVGFY